MSWSWSCYIVLSWNLLTQLQRKDCLLIRRHAGFHDLTVLYVPELFKIAVHEMVYCVIVT